MTSTERNSSSPFLRKPLPQILAERDELCDVNDGGQNTNRVKSTSRLHSRCSYDAIPDTGDDILRGPPAEERTTTLERHLSLADLVAVGFGGTIGSGLFVLAGLAAHEYAGPATVVSWLISGITALLSGCCFAELSGRIPLPGGAYAYNYVAMGELVAVVTATCLSIEYIAAAAAVSRSWGDKCVLWLKEESNDTVWVDEYLDFKSTFNPLALLLSASICVLLLSGIKESKTATNILTVLKLIVVSVMVFGALYYVKPSNWTPFSPFGFGGILRGGESLSADTRFSKTIDEVHNLQCTLSNRNIFRLSWV